MADEISPADKVQAAMAGLETATETSPSVESTVTEPVVETPPVAGNPAWNDLLEMVPEVLRPQLQPKLQEWDQGVQKQFEKYKPYEEFLEHDPGILKAGKQLYDTLNSNPEHVYRQLEEYLRSQGKLGEPQQQTVDLSEDSDEEEGYEDPRLTELQQNQQRMMEHLQRQEAQKVEQEAESWMTKQQELVTKSLQAKGLEPDWGYLLPTAAGLVQQGIDPTKAMEQAVGGFEALVSKYRPSANAGAPLLMSPGGAMPVSKPVEIASMADKDHKAFAAQLLAQALKD